MSELILGVSGLRGIVGQSLTPEVAMRYAAAFGAWLVERHGPCPRVVLAEDGRRGGQALKTAAAAGLMSVGCGVLDIGKATTPSVGVAVDAFGAAAGLQVTASHNPQEWNGLKCLVRGAEAGDGPDACAPDAETADRIIAEFRGRHQRPAPVEGAGDLRQEDDQSHAHWVRVHHAVVDACLDDGVVERRFRVCADSVNTASAYLVTELAEAYGCSLTQLAGLGNGIFPHPPEPTRENLSGAGGLCDAVPALKADVGFAQDPDGDRLAIVDENGRYIGEEYTLALAAEALLGAKAAPSAPLRGAPPPSGTGEDVLVTNLSTSRMLEDVAAAYGARVERTPVGEANVVARMKALKAAGHAVVLGGEGNGGVIWPEVTYVRDSLSAMALTLGLMARTGKTVSQLVAEIDARSPGGGYHIVKRKRPLASKADAAPALERLAEAYSAHRVDTQDGVRIDFDSGPHAGAWVHVRASNTEPILRLIGEAGSEQAAERLLDEVAKRV